MEKTTFSPSMNRRIHLTLAAAIALLAGCGYYLIFRLSNPVIGDLTGGSLPSLVHMLVLTWMAFALTGIKRGYGISSLLLIVSLFAEWRMGYADMTDAIMLITGFCIASITATTHLRHVPEKFFAPNTALCSGALLLCSMVFITGTTCANGDCSSNYREARPVYMDFQTLRSSITVSDPRPLKDVSRVYVYQNAVLLNSKNEGIHVLDNRDPSNPINAAFIEIPGNTEISIRDSYLYVDSYVDLVTLDVSDPDNVQEVDREQNIFEYDAYQNVPDDVYLSNIDETRGVVISYELVN